MEPEVYICAALRPRFPANDIVFARVIYSSGSRVCIFAKSSSTAIVTFSLFLLYSISSLFTPLLSLTLNFSSSLTILILYQLLTFTTHSDCESINSSRLRVLSLHVQTFVTRLINIILKKCFGGKRHTVTSVAISYVVNMLYLRSKFGITFIVDYKMLVWQSNSH